MPAPFEVRYQYFLKDLEATFPNRRLGLSIQEVATWLSSAYGISDSSELCRRRLHSMETQLGRPTLLGKDLKYPIPDLAWDMAMGFENSNESEAAITQRARAPVTPKTKKTRAPHHKKDFVFGSQARRAAPSAVGFISKLDVEGNETLWTWAPEQPVQGVDLILVSRYLPESQLKRATQVSNFWEQVERELHAIEAKTIAQERMEQSTRVVPTHKKIKHYT